MNTRIPDLRLRPLVDRPPSPQGAFVLYWMTAFRRLDANFALERACEWARELDRPLVILEALRTGYPWASRRLHRFVLDGMADHARRLEGSRVLYHPYVEPRAGAGKGLLAALAKEAAVVVADDSPAFFLPRMLSAAARKLKVRLEAVDSNGLLPLRAADKVHLTAHSFRRFLQKTLPGHLADAPRPHPLTGAPLPEATALPAAITRRWPVAEAGLLGDDEEALARLPVAAEPAPVKLRGGPGAAGRLLDRFLDGGLPRYAEDRNDPSLGGGSGLSPYLHFGHISTHQVFAAVADREDWTPARLSSDTSGSRAGWWGMGASAEAFLDQIVTWRELGFNMAWQRDDTEKYGSLPGWAQETLAAHAGDERPYLYTARQLDAADTHDEVWNAAQRQLRQEGIIHNYMRMLWGKKILEWTPSPKKALAIMLDLNNRYALDGRDPNSASGIFWCLGRYDRPWGPERPVFGTVRYMTSDSTRRKFRLGPYLERFGGA